MAFIMLFSAIGVSLALFTDEERGEQTNSFDAVMLEDNMVYKYKSTIGRSLIGETYMANAIKLTPSGDTGNIYVRASINFASDNEVAKDKLKFESFTIPTEAASGYSWKRFGDYWYLTNNSGSLVALNSTQTGEVFNFLNVEDTLTPEMSTSQMGESDEVTVEITVESALTSLFSGTTDFSDINAGFDKANPEHKTPTGTYTVTFMQDDVVLSQSTVGYGGSVVIPEATPGVGEVFGSWNTRTSGEGATIKDYQFSYITQDLTVYAMFDTSTCKVEIVQTAGGTITPEETTFVKYGSDLQLYFNADANYILNRVFIDDVNVGQYESYILENITKDMKVEAEFIADYIMLDINGGTGSQPTVTYNGSHTKFMLEEGIEPDYAGNKTFYYYSTNKNDNEQGQNGERYDLGIWYDLPNLNGTTTLYAIYLEPTDASVTDYIVISEEVTNLASVASTAKYVTLPRTTTTIADSVLSGHTSLTGISWSDNITTIGANAFNGCSSLTSVRMPTSLTGEGLGAGAFTNCSQLTTVTNLENTTITRLNDRTFYGCVKLEEVSLPSTLIKIGQDVFVDCYKLQAIHNLENTSVNEIGMSAFAQCTSLESISLPSSLEILGQTAFATCSSLRVVENLGATKITELAMGVFGQCASLEEITIPSTVSSVGVIAFGYCSNLETIENLENTNITVIPYGAFAECKSLSNIRLPQTLAEIGEYAFYNCSSLISVEFNPNVSILGESAFELCSSLNRLVGFEESQITEIPTKAFLDCVSITDVVISDKIINIGVSAFENNTALINLTFMKTGDVNNTTLIASTSFTGTTSNLRVNIPGSDDIDNYISLLNGKGFADNAVMYYTGDINRRAYYKSGQWIKYDDVTIISSVEDNGTITPNGEVTYELGSTATYVISPDIGYKISEIFVDDLSINFSVEDGKSFEYQFTNLIEDHKIHATFEIRVFSITSTAGANGTITPSGTKNYEYGESPSYTITPNTGYRVSSITVDGASVTETAPGEYTFHNIQQNHTIEVVFEKITFTLTASIGPNGSMSPTNTTITVGYGESYTWTFTPAKEYKISEIAVDGESLDLTSVNVLAAYKYQFTNVQANHTITVDFASTAVVLTYNANGGYFATTDVLSKTQTYSTVASNTSYATTITLYTPNPVRPNHTFTGWNTKEDGTGESVVSGAVYTTLFGSIDAEIFAIWKINTYTITTRAEANGKITDTATVNHGSSFTVEMTPNEGYKVSSYTIDGSAYTPTGEEGKSVYYTFANIQANHEIVASFAARSFTITFDKQNGYGGTDSVVATFDQPMPNIIAPEKEGYTFKGYSNSKDIQELGVMISEISPGTHRINLCKPSTTTYAVDLLTLNTKFNLAFMVDNDPAGYRVEFNDIRIDDYETYQYGSKYIININHTIKQWDITGKDDRSYAYDTLRFIDLEGTPGTIIVLNASYGANLYYDINSESAKNWDIASDTTLYAVWDANKYTVTFVPGSGATVTPASKEVTFDQKYGELPIPSKTGYTFTGWKEEYQIVDFIESTGTQYIDTGIKANQDTSIEIKAYTLTTRSIYGGTPAFLNQTANSSGEYFYWNGYDTGNSTIEVKTGKPTIYFQDKNNAYRDGVLKKTWAYTSWADSNNLFLFARNNAGTANDIATGKIYYCKMWNAGVLVRDFVPCIRTTDSVAGLLDQVEGKFYSSPVGNFLTSNIYRELDYIESTGSQYINTEYYWKNENVRVYMDAVVTSNSSSQSLFGNEEHHAAGSANRNFAGIPHGSAGKFNMYVGQGGRGSVNLGINTRFTLDLSTTATKVLTVEKDGVKALSATYSKTVLARQNAMSPGETTGYIYIFANHNSGEAGTNDAAIQQIGGMKLYAFKMWDGGVLVRDFVPCVRSTDSVVGLWDKVEGKFYSSPVGNFVAPYTPVDFIQSSGTQYIDTGFKPDQDTRVYLKAMPLSVANSGAFIYSAAGSGWDVDSFEVYPWGNRLQYNYAGKSITLGTLTDQANQIFFIDQNKNNVSLKTSGGLSVTGALTYTKFEAPVNLTLGALNRNGTITPKALRIYECKIWDDGTLVRDFVPCVKDGVAGLWDKVEGKFYSSPAGTFASSETIGQSMTITADSIVKTAGDHGLSASYTPIKYNVLYNANSGTGSMEPTEHVYDQLKLLRKNSFEKTGHHFIGWAYTADGEVEFGDEDEVFNLRDSAGDVSLFAKWAPIEYENTFSATLGWLDAYTFADPSMSTRFTFNKNTSIIKSTGGSGWEVMYVPVNLEAGRTYTFEWFYHMPTLTANHLGGAETGQRLRVQLFNQVPAATDYNGNTAMVVAVHNDMTSATSGKATMTYTCPTTKTYYFAFNFGYCDDSEKTYYITPVVVSTKVKTTFGQNYNIPSIIERQYFDTDGYNDNMFNFTDFVNSWYAVGGGTYQTGNGSSVVVNTESEKSIAITASGGDCYTSTNKDSKAYLIPVEAGQTYTLSWTQSVQTNAVRNFIFPYKNYKSTSESWSGLNETEAYNSSLGRYYVTHTIPAGCTYVQFRFGMNGYTGTIKISDIKFEKGDLTAYSSTKITSSMTHTKPISQHFYAINTKNNMYTVTLNKNSGTGGTSSVRAVYGEYMLYVPSAPTRTGYTFMGYTENTSFSVMTTSKSQWDSIPTSRINLTDVNGAQTLLAAGIKIALTLSINVDPTSFGVEFNDKSLGSAGGNYWSYYQSGSNYIININYTILAEHISDTYATYRFFDLQGVGTSATVTVLAAAYNTYIYYDKNMVGSAIWDKESDGTLYAWWKANNYTVTVKNTVTMPLQASNGLQSGVRVAYNKSNQYLFLNGTLSSSLEFDFLTLPSALLVDNNTQYYVYLDYISGSVSMSAGCMVMELYDSSSAKLSTRAYIDFTPTNADKQYGPMTTTLRTSVSKMKFWIYYNGSCTFNNYVVRIHMVAITSKTQTIVATYDQTPASVTLPSTTGYSGADYVVEGYYTGIAGTGTKYVASDGDFTDTYTNPSSLTLYANWLKMNDGPFYGISQGDTFDSTNQLTLSSGTYKTTGTDGFGVISDLSQYGNICAVGIYALGNEPAAGWQLFWANSSTSYSENFSVKVKGTGGYLFQIFEIPEQTYNSVRLDFGDAADFSIAFVDIFVFTRTKPASFPNGSAVIFPDLQFNAENSYNSTPYMTSALKVWNFTEGDIITNEGTLSCSWSGDLTGSLPYLYKGSVTTSTTYSSIKATRSYKVGYKTYTRTYDIGSITITP